MERLTQRINGVVVYVGAHSKDTVGQTPFEVSSRGIREILARLAEYEDTGLAPEEVERTKLSLMGKAISEITEFDEVSIDRLKELSRADKDGRVAILPCKVGDTVYVSYEDGYISCIVDRIHVLANNETQIRARYLVTETLLISASEFSKTVFLTREEAEEALRRAENG